MLSELVPDWLERRAAARPDHPGVIAEGRAVTYAELLRGARGAAAHLTEMGVGRGDRVAVLLRNGIEFVEIMYGLMRCGAVLVPLHTRLTPREVVRQILDCGSTVLLGSRATLNAMADVREDIPRVKFRCPREVRPERGARDTDLTPREESRIDLAAAHSVIYTSGSTGSAKGARLTYGNYWWGALGSAMNLGVHADDRWLACLPFCHVGGLSILLRSVIYGTTAVIHDGFDPIRVNRAIDEDRVTIVSVVATMLRRMLGERGARPYPSSLRCVLVGGGPVPLPLLEECARRDLPVAQTYGLTEAASQVTTLAPDDAWRKRGSAGSPLIHMDVAIASENNLLPAGEVGEILVRGPSISPGYVGESGTAADAQGWFHTGDLGRMDAEGFLYVLGRRDDVIVSGGENVHPAEVETALESHPAVAEVCVTGVPDPEWGHVVAAVLRLREGAKVNESELRDYVRGSLAPFKVPRRFHFTGEFPRTAAGKIRRREVAEWFRR